LEKVSWKLDSFHTDKYRWIEPFFFPFTVSVKTIKDGSLNRMKVNLEWHFLHQVTGQGVYLSGKAKAVAKASLKGR